MLYSKLFLFFFINSFLYANVLLMDANISKYELLQFSQIYIDNTKKLTLKDINHIKFNDANQKLLGFGYSPNFDVWVKFTLHNSTNQEIEKILEYGNPLTTKIEFYDLLISNDSIKEGLLYISNNRKSINPIFKIKLEPYETKMYYLKASSNITTLIVKLNLWEKESFYAKEIQHQFFLALFFGSMTILGLYNLFIFFFTKDRNYLFYFMYIVGIIFHHLMYVGIAYIYILNPNSTATFISYSSLIVGFPALALGLFTKSFLQTKQYPSLDKILKIYLYCFPFLLSIFLITDSFNKYRNIFSVLLLIFLLIITIYATFKKNRQAYFILFGWIIFITSGMFMYLSSLGFFNIYETFPYYVEISLVLEAIIFSIALTDKIKQLQEQKEYAANQLIVHQINEQKKLQTTVEEKTKDLQFALQEKELLLKELNHRVKNNMQTIVSLIRLQCDDIEDENIQDIFKTIQNRINAMSHLHELLYKQDNISFVDTSEYFRLLIEELQDSYEKNIQINYNITTNLKIDRAIYCGLILNELVSNAFKYAFPTQNGIVFVTLKNENQQVILNVKDNGIGFDSSKATNSLGLILVKILAKEQLKGSLSILSQEGTDITITWYENE